jgi:hypothetical protein
LEGGVHTPANLWFELAPVKFTVTENPTGGSRGSLKSKAAVSGLEVLKHPLFIRAEGV